MDIATHDTDEVYWDLYGPEALMDGDFVRLPPRRWEDEFFNFLGSGSTTDMDNTMTSNPELNCGAYAAQFGLTVFAVSP